MKAMSDPMALQMGRPMGVRKRRGVTGGFSEIKMYLWGGAGGNADTYDTDNGGGGGYAFWHGSIRNGTTFYVFVGEGGEGGDGVAGTKAGGWPNGGDAENTGGAGGGMSAICAANALTVNNLIAGAGGGGGATIRSNGEGKAGAGGGTNGQDKPNAPSGLGGNGGTQSAGGTGGPGVDGSLLQGANQTTSGGGGGGGGYYGGEGGVTALNEGGGGGGSGFVRTVGLPSGFRYLDSALETGSGITPAQTGNAKYPGGTLAYAVATAEADGNHGVIVIENVTSGVTVAYFGGGSASQTYTV